MGISLKKNLNVGKKRPRWRNNGTGYNAGDVRVFKYTIAYE